jgi:hypothetical protein
LRRIDDGFTTGQGEHRNHELAGCDQEFFAFQVVDFNDFVVDVFEIENLADLGAKGAGQKLVEFCRHHALRSSIARMVVAFMTPKLR